MELHKVLSRDMSTIIRFCLAEDPDLISIFKTGIGNDLDSSVQSLWELALINPQTNLYKVETETGAIVGYFATAPVINNAWILQGMIMRKTFRTQDYLNAFFDLIRSTFENNLSASLADINFIEPNNLTSNTTITNPIFYINKNYLLLRSN